ncbi:MAG: DNA translocase FtsK 4TM domain-containing protein [Bacteroidota bacterium]
MAENEYVPEQESTIEDSFESVSKRAKENNKKEKSSGKSVKEKSQAKLPEIKFDPKKIKIIFGTLLLLSSLFIFVACISYLFTWQNDQDRILNKSFIDFIFLSENVPVDNWLGKFGAWVSHTFIYGLFGLSSFAFCFILFLVSVKILFDRTLLPLLKTSVSTVLLAFWTSLFLGYFAYSVNYLGGSIGFYSNQWLSLTIGSFGAIILHVSSLFVLITILFKPDYAALFAFLQDRKVNHPKMTESNISSAKEKLKDDADFKIVNPIQEEEIENEYISETIEFDKDEDEIIHTIEDNELEMEIEEPLQTFELEDDFEIDIPQNEYIEPVQPVSSFQHQDELSQSERLVQEFGEYDPKMDLSDYTLPSIDFLKDYGGGVVNINKEELETNKDRIVQTLAHYKIDIAKIKATVGPTVTLYEIVPAPGVRISKIKNLEDDIALSLSALGIRIIAPIPGKGTIGIEVPNSSPEMVSMRSLIASEKFQNFDGELPVVMGKTITNETYVFDLTKMPHLLVAGATGQGKSVGLNAILISILYRKHPAQIKFVLVDPKKVELTLYNKIERHFLAKLPGEEDAIITDTSKVVNTLNSLCVEMDDRYGLLKDAGVRTIKEYNEKFIKRRLNPENGHRYLPYIVVLIDEFADLIMTAGKEVEHPIARIAQLARAIGIHLIVATQRPSVNVITGMIKANFPARIAFRVLSKIDSRTILDASGADQLIGRGDMLISTGSDMKRLQCGFVDTDEVEEICEFIGSQRAYPEALLLPEYHGEDGEGSGDFDISEIDSMFVDSARIVVISQQGSASLLQRKLKLGYNRAGRIVDQLEAMGIIGAFQGSKAREVLFSDIESLDEYLRTKGLL